MASETNVRTGFFIPTLTILLLTCLITTFVLEKRLTSAAGGTPMVLDTGALIALGGLSRNLVAAGEGYRVLSAPFLHANLTHLIDNGCLQ